MIVMWVVSVHVHNKVWENVLNVTQKYIIDVPHYPDQSIKDLINSTYNERYTFS